MTNKTTTLAIFAVAVLLTGTIAGPIGLIQSADALKSKGNPVKEVIQKKSVAIDCVLKYEKK